MSQSKSSSFVEASANALSSLLTAWACWNLIIVPWIKLLNWQILNLNFWQVLAVNTAFTVVGIFRTYAWRRLFDNRS